ncbi:MULTISPECIES: hypothetical protein [Methylobacterium]|uniref:hypothetical protein n=1 Tax=Methylobacterium TaxID=407 RepID=UPI001044CC7F|nr:MULTISPECIES: hypothetical protein [Methylobacterium]MDR7039003.1 hypothetical protein [Methylobacterium sp. BE186]
MTRRPTFPLLGAALLTSGFLAASSAQACTGALCYTRPGGVAARPVVGTPSKVVVPQPTVSNKVNYGHGGIVAAGAGNAKDQLSKGAAVQVSRPPNFR